MNRKIHILSLFAAVIAFCIGLPLFAQNEKACIGTRIMYAADGIPGSVFEYRLEQAHAGTITQTYVDTIIVEWGDTKGVFQLGVREISPTGCVGNWAFLNVEVVGEYAQFAQSEYSICREGGVFVDFNKNDFLAYNWVDPSVSNGHITKPGRYELITIDQNYCRLSSFIDVVENPVRVSLGADTMICTPGFTLHALNTQDNPAETVYTWSTGESGAFLTQITVDDHDMEQDTKYWVRAEFNGCVVSDTITVLACKIEVVPDYRIPNTFTPNDDGENDVWNMYMLRDYPDCIVEVFDRWGRKVFTSTRGYTVPWDGRDATGRYLPMEAYYYIIHLNDGTAKEPIIGTITIIR